MVNNQSEELDPLRAEVARLRDELASRPERTTVWQDASDEGYRLQVAHAETRAEAVRVDRDAWKEVAEINDGSAKQAIERAEAAEDKVARVEALAERWDGYGHGPYNIHMEESLPCSACGLLADLRAVLDDVKSDSSSAVDPFGG